MPACIVFINNRRVWEGNGNWLNLLPQDGLRRFEVETNIPNVYDVQRIVVDGRPYVVEDGASGDNRTIFNVYV